MEPTTSLRDAIESALDPEDETGAPASDAGLPDVVNTAADEPALDSAPAAEGEQDLDALTDGEPQNEDVQQQTRDEAGKFAKNEGMTPGPKSGPRQQSEKAPASWKPDVREHWGQLPDTVRAEIHRREVEVQRTLQDTAEARKTAEAVMKTIAPYEAFIKAENSNPLQAIDNLMSTAARLRTGTAPELAQMVAGIVNQFGIGRFGNNFIEMLDSALAGQTPKAPDQTTAAVEQVINQRLAPVQQMLTQFQQAQVMQQQQVQERAANEVQTFISKAEFGEDVREDMADILETAQRRGQSMTLQQAYEKACYLNDSVRKVLDQRRLSQGAQVQTKAAQRARSAAVSVSGAAPIGAPRQDPVDVRSAIEAAISMSSR